MILVVAECTSSGVTKTTLEMIGLARTLAASSELAVLVAGAGVDAAAEAAAAYSEQVLVAEYAELQWFDAERFAAAVTQIARESEAELVLMAANRNGRAYSPRVAVRLQAALLEDVQQLQRSGGALQAERSCLLNRCVATIKPGAFTAAEPLPEPGEQYSVELTLPSARVMVQQHERTGGARIALAEAEVVVAGGRGLGDAASFAYIVEGFADRMGAAVAATRAAVDAGWRDYAEQVGQTGKTVQPKLYWALGISGAVQHLSGMIKSKTIVAINRDADAPIFKVADYGIVGDVRQIVPAIMERL
jgi:electron transfer flavoprotein alpha subunit